MDAKRRQTLFAMLLGLAGMRRAGAREISTLSLGVMPVFGIRALMRRYEPLRAFLSRVVAQPVRVETAPDFRSFLGSVLAGEFDIVVAAAHFARMAQLDKGWVPLVQLEPDHDTLLITRARGGIRKIGDLAGGEVAVIDRLAITVMGALRHIGQQGLHIEKDFRVTEYRNHTSVVHSLLAGASTMAVTTSQGLSQIPSDMREQVTVFARLSDIPAFVVLASPEMPKATCEELRAALLSFARQSEGLDFLAQNSYTGLHVADAAAMRRADPYLKETRRMVGK